MNGETIHLRALTAWQLETVKPFQQEDSSVGFVIGSSVVNDDGSPVFIQETGEPPEAFGDRVLNAIDLARDVQKQIVDKIFVITNEPDKVQHEAIVKNS